MIEYRFTRIIWLLCLALAMTGCSEDLVSSGSDDEIKPGDPVLFAPYLSSRAMTRTEVAGYSTASNDYNFTYKLYKQVETVNTIIAEGSQLYWPDNQIAYAFMAKAGSETLAADQDSYEEFLLQDKLEGYGGVPNDTRDVLVYRTSKNWKTANETDGVSSPDSKKIRLYLKHLRSRITVILKAGEGVSRDDLANTNYLEAKIYSYGTSNLEISPWATNTTIDYDDASGVSTTQYTAIVEPYDYQANSEKVIARISVSGQPFTFSVNNESDNEKKSNYYLTAGKHLIIEATLARGDAQKVLLTAQIVPWDVISTNATVGDDGLVGSTTDIDSRAGLLAFLSGENNKAGNIANITADIDLESGEAWTSQPLNCTMKLNNHTISTTHPVFTTIGALGKVEGGTISVSGDATVNAAVATTNLGTIKNVTVSRSSTGKASQGGLVVTNSGTISTCTSNLPVYGASDVVGGIAKESVYHSDNGSMPVIEGCIANARVEGSGETVGGGIVGRAVGRVSGNTFNYGITLLQEADKFKNIVYGKPDAETHQLRAYSNSWPTTAANTIGNHSSNNSNTMAAANIFDATIDSQTELATLLNNVYNIVGSKYRVSDNFTVSAETWNSGNIPALFTLNGNNKTISKEGDVNLSYIYSVSTNLRIL